MEEEELPIERGFPIEKVNELAEKEGWSKRTYRPIYTMHKWWARRLGSVFRTICLYTLLDDPEKVSAEHPGSNQRIDKARIESIIDEIDLANPESLWELYSKDVTVEDKKVLDPFMGGGTTLVEASRFGAEVHGRDLNPVAWFVTKKELEASQTDINELEKAFEKVKNEIADELKNYYRTPCPNGDHKADAMYYLWVKELDCVSCGNTVPLFSDYRIGKGRFDHKDRYNVLCPKCESVVLVESWREEGECSECGNIFVAQDGTATGAKYTCSNCGQKYNITDAIQEQNGFDMRMYAVEYYCPECDKHKGKSQGDVKGYKDVEFDDIELYEEAEQEWEASDELHKYVPNEEIREGHMTAERNDVFAHGYKNWTDFFNKRQLLSLSKLLKSIDTINSQNVKEYLLLAMTDSLMFQNMMSIYSTGANKIEGVFKTKSFDPPSTPAENNVWGTKYGRSTFKNSYEMVKKGVEFAHSPTERYLKNGDTIETEPFSTPIGIKTKISLGDVREIDVKNQYDVVITDPPYYENIIYSELSDFFYVWQKILLEDVYEGFEDDATPRANSIVANPAEGKGEKEFEDEIRQAFNSIHNALKEDGVLTFTYHHSDSESWGELLEALCDVGFKVTATYPITADVQRLTKGETVEFDIIVVARPTEETRSIAWEDLRLQIYDTARETRKRLEQNRDLSRGDIGVIEMGECFQEYSKYHGNVYCADEVMDAKEVVDEIYGIIQEASDIGATEVFIDLLETDDPDYDDVNKLCRGANTTPDELRDMRLFNTDDGFGLGRWNNEKRIAYLEDQLREGEFTPLDKLQFLRYRYDRGKRIGRYVEDWLDPELRRLAAKMVEATGDNTFEDMLDIRSSDEGEAREEGGQAQIDDYEEK